MQDVNETSCAPKKQSKKCCWPRCEIKASFSEASQFYCKQHYANRCSRCGNASQAFIVNKYYCLWCLRFASSEQRKSHSRVGIDCASSEGKTEVGRNPKAKGKQTGEDGQEGSCKGDDA